MLISNNYCLSLQNGLDTKVEKSRKQLKERKNRAKKIRGVKKVTKTSMKFKLCCHLSLSLWLDFAISFNCCYFSYVQAKAGDAAKAKKK